MALTVADIYSQADRLKRRVKDFASNPLESLLQTAGYGAQRAQEFQGLNEIALQGDLARMRGQELTAEQVAAENKVRDIWASAYNPMGITVYHGSPFDFLKFDISKAGSGAKASNFGHGVYFAEHPEVAGMYKKARIPLAENPEGNLYKADIPDELLPKMLNWYEDVPENIRKTLSEKAMKIWGSGLSPSSGEKLYKEIVFNFKQQGSKNPAADASAWLAEQGVPGINYENMQMVKGMGRDTNNYVVFDPSIVKMLEKNQMPVE